jgi:hypothetical protein
MLYNESNFEINYLKSIQVIIMNDEQIQDKKDRLCNDPQKINWQKLVYLSLEVIGILPSSWKVY